MPRRALVTGATGFIGAEILAGLRSEDREVWALVRDPRSAERLVSSSAVTGVRYGELADRSTLERALEGADEVVHLAAAVDPRLAGDAHAQRRITRDAAILLGELASAAGVSRFVFMSSIAAMGFFSGVATANSPCDPRTEYGRAKLAAERALLPLARPGFDVFVLRPPTVYGPGERYNFLSWARAVERGRFRLIGDGRNAFPLVTTRNLARVVRAALDGRLSGGTYLVADREPYSVLRIHRALLAALGKSEPRLRLPVALAFSLGRANELARSVLPSVPLVLTRARVRTLTADQPFDVRPLLVAGVELDAPLEEWVELTVDDYRRRGVLGPA